ncbi:MAG: anthranilate phosphoribosyltransferase [bacterium]|nr:anthranilate phosphoribosyltransferase [bacterium]
MWNLNFRTDPKILINKVISGKDLNELEAKRLMNQIAARNITHRQIKEFLTALQIKGATVDEITGFARALRRNSIKVNASSYPLVDVCGTGGDNTNTFNISTAAAFIAAGAGVKIAKHGSVAISSKCGSADVLKELGVKINLTPAQVAYCIDQVGIGFLFAPLFHPVLKFVAPDRARIGTRTVFNLLGPLINPANVTRQVIGVYDPKLVFPIGQVLKNLRIKRAFVVHGAGCLDEISTLGETEVADLNFGIVTHYKIVPESFGIKRNNISEILGGSPKENALIIKICLDPRLPSTHRDIALINAAAAIVVSGLAVNLNKGLNLAKESVYSGNARSTLEELIYFSNL